MPEGHVVAPPWLVELRLTSAYATDRDVAQNLATVEAKAREHGFTVARSELFAVSEEGELRSPPGPCDECGAHHLGPCAEAADPEPLPEWMVGA